MVTDVFALEVQRGLGFVVPDMPRVVESKIHVGLPAPEAWRLRCNFDLEKYIAALGNRTLTLIEEETVSKGLVEEQTQRLVRCELVGEHLGGAMMGAITSKDLVSEISSSFYAQRFDEDHGASFVVEMLKVRIDVHMKGHQWCVPDTPTSCYLCTRIDLTVRVPGVGALIEMKIERQLRASHAAFPKHALDYLQKREETSTRTALVTSPPSSPEPAPSKLPDCPTPCVRNATEPRLNRCQLAWALCVAIVLSGARRHRMLTAGGASAGPAHPNQVVVRMGGRKARMLVLCGCANVVEQDEIVE